MSFYGHFSTHQPDQSVNTESLVQYLDEYLAIEGFPDYPAAYNGLQVEGPTEVSRAAVAVDGSEAVIQEAVTRGVDLLIVHHGVFWDGKARMVGPRFRKMRALIEGKVALVSGANRGIGLAISKALLANGIQKLFAGARNPESLNALVQEAPERVVPVRLDVTDEESIRAVAQLVTNVDILVNNAGVFQMGGIFSDEAVRSLSTNLDVNLWGLINLTRALSGSIRSGGQAPGGSAG